MQRHPNIFTINVIQAQIPEINSLPVPQFGQLLGCSNILQHSFCGTAPCEGLSQAGLAVEECRQLVDVVGVIKNDLLSLPTGLSLKLYGDNKLATMSQFASGRTPMMCCWGGG